MNNQLQGIIEKHCQRLLSLIKYKQTVRDTVA